MSEFEEKLNAILGDENAMGQIMSLAQSLGGGGGEPPVPRECGEARRDEALLEALRPYLKQERRQKLDRTLEILRLLRLMKGNL